MSNQASEDELRDELYDFLTGADSGTGERTLAFIASELAEYVQALIRTEKLKLLAEVRERVVGENQHSEHKEWDCPCGVTHSFTEEWHATNRLRDEQRTALTKLEAEL